MAHTLITFLGKVQKEQGGNYRTATYRFQNGQEYTTSFFGHALQQHIRPDRLVVLGTSGSMWDTLVESFQLGDEFADERIALIEAAEEDRTTQPQLDALAPVLSRQLGVTCELRLIDYGENEAGQINILQTIAAAGIQAGEGLSLDITHGLRHLPVFVMLSAIYLKTAFKVDIHGIYYGALEMRKQPQNIAPVLELQGLLRIADWVGALHAFDKDGDYSIFSPLLQADQVKQTELLENAAFFERIGNISQAAQATCTFSNSLPSSLPGISGLFQTTLQERLSWHKGHTPYQRQRRLAEFYLDNRDYLRASIFMLEAFVTSLLKNGEDFSDYSVRGQVEKEFKNGSRGNAAKLDDFNTLKNLRNGMAHGNKPSNRDAQKFIASEEKLKTELKRLLNALLP